MKPQVLLIILAAMTTVHGCSTRDTSPDASKGPPIEERPLAAPEAFVNRVWVVAESEQVAQGELRVFLSEGTLVMASPHATPAFGAWTYEDGRLKITEESREYEVDILELTRDSFHIRMHSPGEPVVIRLAPAEPSPGDPKGGKP